MIEGKIALVTGGGSGIGQAVALRFAASGALVVVADISGRRAQITVDRIIERGGKATAAKGDVSDAAGAESIVAKAVDYYGGLDVLVNIAGVSIPGSAVTTSVEDWDRTFAVNVRGGFLCSKFAVPELRRRGGGVILFTASTDGLHGDAGHLAYSASKAAVINMARSMALDHGPHNIRVAAWRRTIKRCCSRHRQ